MTIAAHLSSREARRFLETYGVPFAPWRVVDTSEEAVAAATEIGWPVAIKSAASDIIHKSDAGCVALGIDNSVSLRTSYGVVADNAARAGSATPAHILVEKMTQGLAELVIGIKRDETFGPVVLVGLGGIWVEVMRDYVLRLCPVTPREARDAIGELRGLPLLSGGRGGPACDLDALADMVSAVSRLAMEKSNLVELDINPVVAFEHGAVAIDARVILMEGEEP